MVRWTGPLLALAILLAGPSAEAADPPAPDPRDAALAAFVGEATGQIVSAARGEPVDPAWGFVGEQYEGLAATSAETREAVQGLGPAFEVLGTFLELEAVVEGPEGVIYLRSGAVVFPDQRVLWTHVEARMGTGMPTSPELARVAPALAGAVERVVETLRSPACGLPLVTAADVAHLPEAIRGEVDRAGPGLKDACGRFLGGDGAWRPRVDDVSVLVRGEGRTAILRSAFEVTGKGVGLYPVRFRDLP